MDVMRILMFMMMGALIALSACSKNECNVEQECNIVTINSDYITAIVRYYYNNNTGKCEASVDYNNPVLFENLADCEVCICNK